MELEKYRMTRKTFFCSIMALSALIIVSGCGSSSVADTYEIVPVGESGSCTQVELRDPSGVSVTVPTDLEEAFSCPTGAVAMARDHKFVVYDTSSADSSTLKLYSILENTTQTLYEFPHALEGLKCIWRDDSQAIACAAVNQEVYVGLTEMVVVLLDQEGNLVSVRNVLQKPGETIDFTCGASCYPGDMWFDEDALKYAGHEMIAPGEIFTISY